MVGRAFGAVTWMVNEGSDTVSTWSVTLMVMRAEVPALAAAGVPERRPVVVLKLAQDGLF